jgi:hypothetical protein
MQLIASIINEKILLPTKLNFFVLIWSPKLFVG